MDVGQIESRQIFVVVARPLAPMHIPGLQRLGRSLVLDDGIDARVDAHLVLDVLVFLAPDFLLARQVGQVDLLLLRQNRALHVPLQPLGLPSGL
jgi:hypothetical protein